jgi:hypothetical protein
MVTAFTAVNFDAGVDVIDKSLAGQFLHVGLLVICGKQHIRRHLNHPCQKWLLQENLRAFLSLDFYHF